MLRYVEIQQKETTAFLSYKRDQAVRKQRSYTFLFMIIAYSQGYT